jgi:hypothetical protein
LLTNEERVEVVEIILKLMKGINPLEAIKDTEDRKLPYSTYMKRIISESADYVLAKQIV